MNDPLVSVITPVYNAERFISEAIQSVLDQSYSNLEMLIVDDGSTDNTAKNILGFNDSRIKYFHQKNRGVSAARNVALEAMRGEFFCFLDADDILPKEAIASRIGLLLEDDSLDFVDGEVTFVDAGLHPTGRRYRPSFHGKPKDRLLRLDQSCLFGNTWMIRRVEGVTYQFDESLSHAEDLFFYLTICFQKNGGYSYTNQEILRYRQSEASAMKNLRGLEEGYYSLLSAIKIKKEASWSQLLYLRMRITRIMFLSYLINGRDVLSAIRILPKFLIA